MKPETDCARYEALVEQALLEEHPLSEDEQRLLSQHPRHCDRCAPESALWERLSQVRDAHARQGSPPRDSGPAMERLLGRVQERRLSQRRQRRAWVVAPAAAVALLLGVLWLLQRSSDTATPPSPATKGATTPATAHLGLVSGAVQVAGIPAVAGRRLHPDEPLSTADGLAVIIFDDASRVVLEPRSTVVLRATARSRVRLQLLRGAATFQVTPRQASARFHVEAGWARVEVLGTLFQVATGPRPAQVAVARGRVRVVQPGVGVVILSAGQQLNRSGAPQSLREPRRLHVLRRLALASLLPTQAAGVLLVRSTPTGASLRLDGRPLGATPLSVRVVPGDYALALGAPGYTRHKESVRVGGSAQVEVSRTLHPLLGGAMTSAPTPPFAPSTPTRTPPRSRRDSGVRRPPPPPTPTTVATLLQQIRTRRAAGDWRGAVTGYRTLRRLHPRAPESSTCLVLMGQIQLRHLAQTRAALRSFERYLRVGGSLAPEATWGRIQALGKLGRRAAELQACRAFLKRYARSLYAPQVRKRLRQLTAGQKK